jgi:hypothetical protein
VAVILLRTFLFPASAPPPCGLQPALGFLGADNRLLCPLASPECTLPRLLGGFGEIGHVRSLPDCYPGQN